MKPWDWLFRARGWGHGARRRTDHPSDRLRMLAVDLSTIAQHDAGTGIQRVVRSLWEQLRQATLPGFELVAVAATVKGGYRRADLSDGGIALPDPKQPLVELQSGDIFLGLDLAAHRLWRHRRQVARWQRHGASIAMVIYDILPLRRPDWFPPSTARHFGRWIRIIERHCDTALCISQSVSVDLDDVLRTRRSKRRPVIRHALLPLSGDIGASRPSRGMDADGHALLMRMRRRPTILMVATVEPRKAHAPLLDAFDRLQGRLGEQAPDLVMVGRPGWRTEDVQRRMTDHARTCAGFHWLRDVSDEFLTALYDNAALVVVPSLGEGYGLPIVEALRHGRRVLARDLPVFRELQQSGLDYFPSDAPDALADAIIASMNAPQPPSINYAGGWDESLARLLKALAIAQAPAVNDRPLASDISPGL